MLEPHYYTDGIESERLVSRFLTEEDIPLWAVFFEDEDAVRFHPNPEHLTNMQRAEYWIKRQLQRYQDHYYGHQALIDKQTNEMIGQCGLLLQDVEGVPEIEVGYHIFRKHWGKGYATEAARRFRDFGFEVGQEESIVSLIDIHNIRSQRVAVKNGMQRGEQLFRSGHDIYVYRIEREEWCSKNKNPF